MMNRIRNKIITGLMSLAMVLMPALFLVNTTTSVSYALPSTSSTSSEYSARKEIDFNSGWLFSKGQGKVNSGSAVETMYTQTFIPNTVPVYSTDFFDSTSYSSYNKMIGETDGLWKEVSLPHTYNDDDTFDNYVEGTNYNADNSGEYNNNVSYTYDGEKQEYTGTAWYKKTFFMPTDYANKSIVLEFEGARQTAQVWVNGTSIPGKYLNGFIAFGYDISSYLTFGA